ncbi:alpha/beta hydrolase [Corynebacterium halotolerans]|uniref:Alpha/beta-hydrolase family protein n=1 Tax=Corynebacterium halotolerans YIM 70093 = DSM 44683 TaxID=1121362 RepID=M1NKI0_9CORY|nr:alpha/beta hydrolase [Corynebacterium halotolerans]AGF71913.1 hypothetical protein A605_04520 [Corynebacterium halotolerans YIM 70093 = DSM 44683]
MAGAGASATVVRETVARDSAWVRVWNRWHLHPWGLIGATIMFALGLTPSLLPRDWFYQGLVSGLAAGIGYGLGTGLHAVWVRWLRDRLGPRLNRHLEELSDRTRAVLEIALIVVSLLWLVGMVIFSLRWQRGIAELTGARALGLWEYLLVLPVGGVVFLAVVLLGRGLRLLARWLSNRVPNRLTPSIRGVIAWLAVAVALVFVVEQAIPGTLVRIGERVFSARYADPEEGTVPPTIPERSASPGSHVDWDGVGTYGARFLNQGLHADQLSELTGRPAEEPIRLYAGIGNEPTDAGRAGLIIDELERTDATEREAMLVVVTTGTGWVNPQTAQAFELLYGGDTAVVAAQYSAMPSPLHFLAGGEEVRGAGREFVTPIVDWWNALPEEDRPKLYLYGESLGSTGIEAAFSGMRDIANSVDGILLTGPPRFNPLHTQFTERRDLGTPAVAPEYSGGLVVRFAAHTEQIRSWAGEPAEAWGPTRMLYVQHPSDPVAWWTPQLILREPDWLEEPAGHDRLPAMQWLPFITFLQVSADLPVSQNVPDGHGHNYGDAMLDGFAAIAGPGRFTVADVDRLEPLLEEALGMAGNSEFG